MVLPGPHAMSAKSEPKEQISLSLRIGARRTFPWCKTLVTLLCKPSRGPELALGPLGAPEYESRLNSRSRVPLSTFSCRFYQLRWWSPAEVHWTVHVDCPRGQIQTF